MVNLCYCKSKELEYKNFIYGNEYEYEEAEEEYSEIINVWNEYGQPFCVHCDDMNKYFVKCREKKRR